MSFYTQNPDKLIAGITPGANAVGVVLKQLESDTADTTLERGTVLGVNDAGKCVIYGGSAESKTAEFNGDGSTKTFTLTDKPAVVSSVKVGDADAAVDDYNAYTGVITLHTAPAAGTKNVKVSYVMPTGFTPAYILSDKATVTDAADVNAVAYRSGSFNAAALVVAPGYTLTNADRQALRCRDIILVDIV